MADNGFDKLYWLAPMEGGLEFFGPPERILEPTSWPSRGPVGEVALDGRDPVVHRGSVIPFGDGMSLGRYFDSKDRPIAHRRTDRALWHLTERPGRDFRRRRDSAIIRLFLATGIRVGEMAGLHQDDLDLRGQIVTVGGKGRKWRRVPYSGAAAISLDRYLAVRNENRWASQTERVWLGIKGHMTVSGIQDVVERMGALAGVADLHPHQLRHVFVDGCFADGMTEKDVESLMGWSSSAMSRRYASGRGAQRAIETYRRLAGCQLPRRATTIGE